MDAHLSFSLSSGFLLTPSLLLQRKISNLDSLVYNISFHFFIVQLFFFFSYHSLLSFFIFRNMGYGITIYSLNTADLSQFFTFESDTGCCREEFKFISKLWCSFHSISFVLNNPMVILSSCHFRFFCSFSVTIFDSFCLSHEYCTPCFEIFNFLVICLYE